MPDEPVTITVAVEITAPRDETATRALEEATRQLRLVLPEGARQVDAVAIRDLPIKNIHAVVPDIPVEHPGPAYVSLDYGPWEPSGHQCGDIAPDPEHAGCEQPVMQRTVAAVYLSTRVELGVELEEHTRHAEGGEGELVDRIEEAIDWQLGEDSGTAASTAAAEAVMSTVVAPALAARDARIAELEEAERTLQALENAGVDNWPGYDEAMAQLREQGQS